MNERNLLSAILMDTSEEHHMKCNICLETSEDCGLSDLEKIHVTEIWQHPTEGIIMLMIEGLGECELEDFEECIPQIYKEIKEQEEPSMMFLSDAQIAAQYEDFKVVGFKYDHNRYSEGFSGTIEIEFPKADHEDFDDYKCDNFIAYDDECKRIAFDNWYPEEVYYNLCMYIRKHIMNN